MVDNKFQISSVNFDDTGEVLSVKVQNFDSKQSYILVRSIECDWIVDEEVKSYICSCCGDSVWDYHKVIPNYCPICGGKVHQLKVDEIDKMKKPVAYIDWD